MFHLCHYFHMLRVCTRSPPCFSLGSSLILKPRESICQIMSPRVDWGPKTRGDQMFSTNITQAWQAKPRTNITSWNPRHGNDFAFFLPVGPVAIFASWLARPLITTVMTMTMAGWIFLWFHHHITIIFIAAVTLVKAKKILLRLLWSATTQVTETS